MSAHRGRRRWTWRARVAATAMSVAMPGVAIAYPSLHSQATSSDDPYSTPLVIDTNPDPGIVETTIVADETTIDIGGVDAHAFTFNGTVPGPQFRLTPGQRVIVHFENHLGEEATGIHWHGIELANASDGTPLTQNQVEPGDSFLYEFVVPRPGIYWYHPHHHTSTNQVFKGLYGSIIVSDPNEAELVADGTLPNANDTLTLMLGDTTVCKETGGNDLATYDSSLPWAGGGPLPTQPGPFPTSLCDTPVDAHGSPTGVPLDEGDIPNVQKSGRTNEGQTLLTNGMNVGARGGTPTVPGPLAAGAHTRPVAPGSGLRLQLINPATTRFMRLLLTEADGTPIPLVRVGGEGGLLDDAVLEGTQPGGYEFKFGSGEILLDPGDRADVVAAIPTDAGGVATLWTQDFQRTGGQDQQQGWTNTPTVPVAHFDVTGAAANPTFTIDAGTALRSATGDPVDVLPPGSSTLLDPATFDDPPLGSAAQNMQLTANGAFPSIDGDKGEHAEGVDYTEQLHEASSCDAVLGDTLELSVQNTTASHHPFHLHGFSIQPRTLTGCPGAVTEHTFPEPEFMDNIDVPPGCTLTYRIHLEDHPLVDGLTPGGGLGRWMIHCHIFFHHALGMVTEIVVVQDDSGNERPYVDADDPLVSADEGDPIEMTGTYMDPEGGPVTLEASAGDIVDNGDGTWSWSHIADGPGGHVYVTATDDHGNTAQTTFIVEATNIAPTVTIDPDQVTTIDEGGTVSVEATFTDPGDDDPYTATIDYGTSAGPQQVSPVLTDTSPPQAGTVSGSHQYGDNGTYTITVSVTDEDGGADSDSVQVTVDNVDPSIALSGDTTLVNGVPTIIGEAGDPIDLAAALTDPGSDDLAVLWNFDDGPPVPDEIDVSLVNPPVPDPLPSPSVQPRAISVDATHTFAKACTYEITAAAGDDDAGSDSDSVDAVMFGNAHVAALTSWWITQYTYPGKKFPGDLSDAVLDCYLAAARHVSDVFDERVPLTTHKQATKVLAPPLLSGSRQALLSSILALWLNVVHGTIDLDKGVNTDLDPEPETSVWGLLEIAEGVYANPSSGLLTHLQYQSWLLRETLEDIVKGVL